MSKMISSVVVQETVSQILSGLVHRYEGKQDSNPNENLERLEMAHIKLEAVLETSSKWQVTDSSLLRWRKKLKRAAQECDDTLCKYKKIILEEEEMEQEVRNSSFPRRIAHATKSFVFSAFRQNSPHESTSRSAVRRFEWFADTASEFLRFVEFGGSTPCRQMPINNSFVRNLFAGMELQHKFVRANDEHDPLLFLLWLVPFFTEEHGGVEACLVFIKKDRKTLEDEFFFSLILQLSESTDIVGIAVKCLQLLFPAHFQPTVDAVRKELTQLPTQDFSWVPYVDPWHRKHWDNLLSFSTEWFRPDPLCCKQHDHQQHNNKLRHMHVSDDLLGTSTSTRDAASLDSVIEVNLQCQIECNKQRTECKYSQRDCHRQKLKAGLLFTPHASAENENMLPAAERSCCSTTTATATMAPIFRKGQRHCEQTDMDLEQLKEMMLPKAIDYFQQNTEATVYQILWKATHGHGTAYIHFGKPGMEGEAPAPAGGARRASTSTSRGGRKVVQAVRRKDEDLQHRTRMVSHLLDLWAAHAPVGLRGLILDWVQIQKEKESQLALAAPVTSAPLPHLKL